MFSGSEKGAKEYESKGQHAKIPMYIVPLSPNSEPYTFNNLDILDVRKENYQFPMLQLLFNIAVFLGIGLLLCCR